MDSTLPHPLTIAAGTLVAFRTLDRVEIDPRWNGPRRYANGGYAAGRFAAGFGAAARVVLRRPVPLGRPLDIRADGRDGALVVRRRRLIAEVSPIEPARGATPPVLPDLERAEAASARHPWTGVAHPLDRCAVCSPHRRDGLGVTPGPLEGTAGVVAAAFHTDSRLADPTERDVVRPEFVWAALDCPSFPAADLAAGRVRLLGTIAVTRYRNVYVGESLVAVGWTLGTRSRSVRTAAALLDADRRVVAVAENIWVAPRGRS